MYTFIRKILNNSNKNCYSKCDSYQEQNLANDSENKALSCILSSERKENQTKEYYSNYLYYTTTSQKAPAVTPCAFKRVMSTLRIDLQKLLRFSWVGRDSFSQITFPPLLCINRFFTLKCRKKPNLEERQSMGVNS